MKQYELREKPFSILPHPDSELIVAVYVNIQKGARDKFRYENMDVTDEELRLWHMAYLSGISSFLEEFFPSSSIVLETVDKTQTAETFDAVVFTDNNSYESKLVNSIVKLALDMAMANRSGLYKHYEQ